MRASWNNWGRVDRSGRGELARPEVGAAFLFFATAPARLANSKNLSQKPKDFSVGANRQPAGLGFVESGVIDQVTILRAKFAGQACCSAANGGAARVAIKAGAARDFSGIVVDGNYLPDALQEDGSGLSVQAGHPSMLATDPCRAALAKSWQSLAQRRGIPWLSAMGQQFAEVAFQLRRQPDVSAASLDYRKMEGARMKRLVRAMGIAPLLVATMLGGHSAGVHAQLSHSAVQALSEGVSEDVAHKNLAVVQKFQKLGPAPALRRAVKIGAISRTDIEEIKRVYESFAPVDFQGKPVRAVDRMDAFLRVLGDDYSRSNRDNRRLLTDILITPVHELLDAVNAPE